MTLTKLLDKQRQEILKTIRSKIKDWCFDYMADCNSDLEFNRPSPPIWEYLDKKLKMLKETK